MSDEDEKALEWGLKTKMQIPRRQKTGQEIEFGQESLGGKGKRKTHQTTSRGKVGSRQSTTTNVVSTTLATTSNKSVYY